ncbi:MAG: chloride channel protein [Bacteroidota bacterium]
MKIKSANILTPTNKSSENSRMLFISLLASIVGIAAGFTAYGLYTLIAFVSNLVFFHRVSVEIPKLQSHLLGYWVVIVPVLGGIVVGLMAKYGSSKIKGHGIPEAMEAVLTNRSRIDPKVAILKPISAAIAIGTGGPFGAEGPIIQTGGALGSLVGQFIHTTAAERKILLACGAAAGMAATFSTPIAAVILAIELLVFEFKARSFIPLVLASTAATAVHFRFMGRGPMFSMGEVDFGIPNSLPMFIVLGLLCGLAAVVFTNAFYWIEDQFERLSKLRIPIDEMWWPAIGGLGLGIIALALPRVLGVGYDTISDILNARLTLVLLLAIVLLKSLALIVSLGSGTSGGLLAPMFMVGAALGGSFALIMNSLFPGLHLSPSAFALVGMAAMFGAASRATFTFIIFAFEIVRDYNAILPLMLGCVIADAVGLLLMKNSIMTEKLARRGLRVHGDYEADILQQTTVAEAMDKKPQTVPSTMPVSELADRIARGDPSVTKHKAVFIQNGNDELAGIITQGDVLRFSEQHLDSPATVLEAGNTLLNVAYPDETLHEALTKMLQNNIGRLPVVDRTHPSKLVGYLGRTQVLEARMDRIKEERVMEEGWIRHARRLAGSEQ